MNKFMQIINNKEELKTFIRFVIVGLSATAIHYSIYLILQSQSIEYNIAYSIGYFISFIMNYIASNYFTFTTIPTIKRSLMFIGAHVFNYVLQIVLLNTYIYFGMNESLAPIFVYCIAVPTNYMLVKIALTNKIHRK
jgi:putative flippase GtrA